MANVDLIINEGTMQGANRIDADGMVAVRDNIVGTDVTMGLGQKIGTVTNASIESLKLTISIDVSDVTLPYILRCSVVGDWGSGVVLADVYEWGT